MTNITCEEMESRPSDQDGWVQWGIKDAQGEFQPLYGLEAHHDDSSAMYFLAASGVCQVKGKYKQGLVEVPEQPKPAVPNVTDAGTEGQVESGQTTEAVNPITEIPLAHWGLGLLALAGFCVVGAIWSKKRTKAKDQTPNYAPDTSVFNREQD